MKKILVVDDDKDLLHFIKHRLSAKGYDVTVTISCEQGLDLFYQLQPSLVILDINVGTADGREMCATIKAHAEYNHIPVLLMSANHEAVSKYHEYKANAGIEKPFTWPDFLKKIEQFNVD